MFKAFNCENCIHGEYIGEYVKGGSRYDCSLGVSDSKDCREYYKEYDLDGKAPEYGGTYTFMAFGCENCVHGEYLDGDWSCSLDITDGNECERHYENDSRM